MNASANIQVTHPQLSSMMAMSLILMIGIAYNVYTDANALYAAFTPFDLPIMVGQTLVGLAFIMAFLAALRLFVFFRKPLIAEATEEGLYMSGIGIVPWEKVHKIWFGTLLGKPQGFRGTFMFIEFLHPIETRKLGLKSTGIYSEQETKSGRYTRIRYWLPFVFPHDKKQFMEIANLYCPHKNWLE